MAYTANTDQFYSHDETLVRENLHDYITIMDPTDMPLFSMLEHVPVTQRVHETPADNLSYDHDLQTADDTVVQEGKDAFVQSGSFLDPNASYPDAYPLRLKSQLQINMRAIDVSNTDRAVLHAGIEDPFLYYLYREMLSLGKWAELQAHWGVLEDEAGTSGEFDTDTVPVAGTTTQASANPRKTDGICTWIAREGSYVNQTTLPSTGVQNKLGVTLRSNLFSNFYEANGKSLSRGLFYDKILKPAHLHGMRIGGSVVLCGSPLKSLIGEFALTAQGAINDRNVNAIDKLLVDTIDVVDTDFGRVYVNLDRYMELQTGSNNVGENITLDSLGSTPGSNYGGATGNVPLTYNTNDSLVVIQPEHWQIGVLRGFGFQPLSPIGDSTKGMIVGEWSVVCRNPIAGTGGTSLLAS